MIQYQVANQDATLGNENWVGVYPESSHEITLPLQCLQHIQSLIVVIFVKSNVLFFQSLKRFLFLKIYVALGNIIVDLLSNYSDYLLGIGNTIDFCD